MKTPSSPWSWAGLAAPILLAVTVPAPTRAACPTGVSWPTPEWPQALAEGAAVDELDAFAFTRVGADADRKGPRTDAVLVVHAGRIVYERYTAGWTAEHPHLTWSVSKSMLAAMLGVAVGEGWLDLEDSICDHYDHALECDTTPGDLLSMASGLDWNEGYEHEPYHLSSVIAMLYGMGALDMAAFVGHHPQEAPPGELYRYSSGDTVLLSAVLAGALPSAMRDTYPQEFLFGPLGMTSAVFEQDRAGTFVGSSYVYATPRDMARFGYLYLQDGCWEDRRILPEGWVEDTTGVNPVFLVEASFEWARDGDEVPGRHFWTNHAVPELGIDAKWPDVPEDAYRAAGHWGQSITVIPSAELVVVRTADDRNPGVVDFNRFLSLALAVAEEAAP
jgi:CubicO group peptidase (beta-lactamase class C family)